MPKGSKDYNFSTAVGILYYICYYFMYTGQIYVVYIPTSSEFPTAGKHQLLYTMNGWLSRRFCVYVTAYCYLRKLKKSIYIIMYIFRFN